MTKQSHLDERGRPVVVVTGMGVVTALGIGKQDNWRALTAGQSGIKQIGRFATDGLRTTVAGEIDYLDCGTYSSAAMCLQIATKAIEEAIGEAGIGSQGKFPGPLVAAVPPFETEWPLRLELARRVGEGTLRVNDKFSSLLAEAGKGELASSFELAQPECVAEWLADEFGTSGQPVSLSTACASGASALTVDAPVDANC